MDEDAQWFTDHPDRKAHIRAPRLERRISPQRAVAYLPEMQGEFWSLGDHDKTRRRVLLLRVNAAGEFLPDNRILKIPVVLFADETVEDRDDILLPWAHQIMVDEGKRQHGLV
jgi:hypothetical protein